MNKAALGLVILFMLLYGISIVEIALFFQWLFSVNLATTAAVVGLILVIPILIDETIFTILTIFIIGVCLEWW